jgi:excisionase family DNA binding protein
MLLTLQEAAARLGKSVRQVRYMIKQGSLTAEKQGGRWVVDSSGLPLSKGQQKAVARKERQLHAAVEKGLGIDEEKRPTRYSVLDLKAFQICRPLYSITVEKLGADHLASLALRLVLTELCRGCHRFNREDKVAAYSLARDKASEAVCELILTGDPEVEKLITAIEQDLMAALAGLLRRLSKRRKN